MRLAKLGDVTFDVITTEEVTLDNEITSHPVEFGRDITDHVKNQPIAVEITGAFTSKGSWERLKVLREYWRDRVLLKYVGRNIFHNMQIASLVTDHPRLNSLGADFQITLVQMEVVSGRRFGESVLGEKMQTQVAKRVNQGRQQVIEQ